MSRTLLRSVSPALVLVAIACDNGATTPTPAATETAKPAETAKAAPLPSASAAAQPSNAAPAESAAPARPRRERAGLAGSMLAAAGDLDLPADKKQAIEQLGGELDAPGPTDPEAQKSLHAAMVEGVKAGKVEMTKLEPSLAQLDKAAGARKDAEVKALDGLHKQLDAAQRKALVEAVKKRQAEREARWKERADADKDKGADAKKRDEERAKRRLERMTSELGLDADQQKKAEPVLKKHQEERGPGGPDGAAGMEEMKKRTAALLTAFEKDTFSAAKLDFGADQKRHREKAKKQVEYLNAMLGILKPEQREKLAGTLEERGGRGRGFGRGRGPGGPGFGGPRGRGPAAVEPPSGEETGEAE
ncbi:MAG: hypothetical protein U0263_33350 [Polyangiaceae bacterium]